MKSLPFLCHHFSSDSLTETLTRWRQLPYGHWGDWGFMIKEILGLDPQFAFCYKTLCCRITNTLICLSRGKWSDRIRKLLPTETLQIDSALCCSALNRICGWFVTFLSPPLSHSLPVAPLMPLTAAAVAPPSPAPPLWALRQNQRESGSDTER